MIGSRLCELQVDQIRATGQRQQDGVPVGRDLGSSDTLVGRESGHVLSCVISTVSTQHFTFATTRVTGFEIPQPERPVIVVRVPAEEKASLCVETQSVHGGRVASERPPTVAFSIRAFRES